MAVGMRAGLTTQGNSTLNGPQEIGLRRTLKSRQKMCLQFVISRNITSQKIVSNLGGL